MLASGWWYYTADRSRIRQRIQQCAVPQVPPSCWTRVTDLWDLSQKVSRARQEPPRTIAAAAKRPNAQSLKSQAVSLLSEGVFNSEHKAYVLLLPHVC